MGVMFEQAILTERKRPWTMAVSVTLQSAFVASVVLVSILTVERMPDFELPAPLPPFSRAPKPVEIVAAEIIRTANSVQQMASGFFEPVRIPQTVAMITDPAPNVGAGSSEGLVGTGLPEGMYQSGPQMFTERNLPAAPAKPQPAAAKTEVTPPAKPVTIGGKVLEAKIIKRVIPEYPPLARQMRVSGTVKLMGIISTEGTVRDLKVVEGHPLLVRAALDAVRQWLYTPTLLNGQPVEVIAPIDVHFTLAAR
jgi:protein TonB